MAKETATQKKKLLQLQVKVVTKNERENGGNVLFAFDVQDSNQGKTARKAFNYQTTDNKELSSFTVGETYTITIEK